MKRKEPKFNISDFDKQEYKNKSIFMSSYYYFVKDFRLTGALDMAKYLLEDCPFTPVGVYRKLLFGANEILPVW